MSSARKRLRVDLCAPPPVPPGHQEVNTSKPAALPPADEEEEEFLLVEEDTTDSSLVITMEESVPETRGKRRGGGGVRRKRVKVHDSEEEEEGAGVELEIDRLLDQALESKSRQHNLTTVNVRNILHEVITNEHVVAMMKAAINETEAVPPPFEPKMTRSRMKEVVEKGEAAALPVWNISPVKKSSEVKAQFVNIPLADEDSSDEEYRPEDEDEDETAEDTFLESDVESTASSPRGSRVNRTEEDRSSPWQSSRKKSRRFRGSMGPPPPPKAPPSRSATDSSFLEELNAVEEELSVCVKPYQPLSVDEQDVSLVACRTRSKRPLTDVPLGLLEAELQAPDITPDMYDYGLGQEDREWTDWLRGLILGDEDECDDEDDPEYNFLADVDEPDKEDYRDDKAVRISKKEVNELMEELFETLKEDLAGQDVDDDDDEETQEPTEEPIRELRTVKDKLALLRRQQSQGCTEATPPGLAPPTASPPASPTALPTEPFILTLNAVQKATLQQQIQQHVQLLTQINLLTSPISSLQTETDTTTHFLYELDVLAHGSELVHQRCSVFRSANLQGALVLIEEMRKQPITYKPHYRPKDGQGRIRKYPVMPAELAWLFATRRVFMYPELLPRWSLDPEHYCPRRNSNFTAAEDCLLVLGLRNMDGCCDPTALISQFILRKTTPQIQRRIRECCRRKNPDNMVKMYRHQGVVGSMPVACGRVKPADHRPPLEKDVNTLPLWLNWSIPFIHQSLKHHGDDSGTPVSAARGARRRRPGQRALMRSWKGRGLSSGGTSLHYPSRLPPDMDFQRIGFVAVKTPLPSTPPPSSSTPPSTHPPVSLSIPPPVSPSVVPLSSSPRPRSPCSPAPGCRALPLPGAAGLVSSSPEAPPSPPPAVTLSSIGQRYGTFARLGRLAARRPLVPCRSHSPPPPPGHTPGGGRREERREEEEEERAGDEREGEKEDDERGGEEQAEDSGLEERGDEELGDEERGDEELEEEGWTHLELPFRLVLSDSSPSHAGSVAPDDDDDLGDTEEKVGSLWCDESEDQRESDVLAFAQDYTNRLCQCVSLVPERAERLLCALEQFERGGDRACPVDLYGRLVAILDRWPQVLRDYAAFLTPTQAQDCGLVAEQRLFERSRTFLRHLEQSLGQDSAHYQEVVSVLQGSSAPDPSNISKISSLLKDHGHLQEEFWVFFKDLHGDRPLPPAAAPAQPQTTTEASHSVSQNALWNRTRKRTTRRQRSKTNRRNGGGVQKRGEEEENRELVAKGEEHRKEKVELPFCARNISVTTPTGERVTVWTREEDRAILTACQQGGANRKTFRRVSTQLGNKTASEVSNRFRHLIQLFHSASHKPTSCSVDDQPINSQEAAPD